MNLVLVESSQGCLDKNIGTELAPRKILKQLNSSLLEKHLEIEIPVSINSFEETLESIEFNSARLEGKNVFIGGDQSISFALFKALKKKIIEKSIGLIVFDSTSNLINSSFPPSNENWLRVLIEKGALNSNNLLLMGLQAFSSTEEEFIKEKNLSIISCKEIFEEKEKVKQKLQEFLNKFDFFYCSIDLNLFYSAENGLSVEQFFELLGLILFSKKVRDFDLVEANPLKDEENKTILIAAKILEKILNSN